MKEGTEELLVKSDSKVVSVDNTIELNEKFAESVQANFFQEMKDFLTELSDVSSTSTSSPEAKVLKESLVENKRFESLDINLNEGVIIKRWKNVENISARLLEFNDEVVLLECLIDKEEGIYEEKEYKRSYFNEFKLEKGKLFKLCYYERASQVMMEIKDNPKLVLEEDFPKINFAKKYSNITLKKRN